jgi:endonuclease YncB( thermonuclease family)
MPNRIASLFLAAALALAAVPGLAQTTTTSPPPPVWPDKGSTITGEAIAWDGETIAIDDKPIRLYGIDAPEMSSDPRGPVARSELDFILAPDRTVTCKAVGLGSNNLPVARCGAGGHDLSEVMVRSGWAFEHRKYSSSYGAAEAEARATGRGFWFDQDKDDWSWLVNTVPTLIGALVAGLIGIITVLWLHRLELASARRSVTAAIGAEIAQILRIVADQGNTSEADDLMDHLSNFQTLISFSRSAPPANIYQSAGDKIGLLDAGLARDIVEFYGEYESLMKIMSLAESRGLWDTAKSQLENFKTLVGNGQAVARKLSNF